MGSAGAMKLKLILKDDPLLQDAIKRCNDPEDLFRLTQKLGLELNKADLLRMEAQTTLTLSDAELEHWFEQPYWQRVLTSLDMTSQQTSQRAPLA